MSFSEQAARAASVLHDETDVQSDVIPTIGNHLGASSGNGAGGYPPTTVTWHGSALPRSSLTAQANEMATYLAANATNVDNTLNSVKTELKVSIFIR